MEGVWREYCGGVEVVKRGCGGGAEGVWMGCGGGVERVLSGMYARSKEDMGGVRKILEELGK